jgi:Pectate lyase superfamily protein
MTLSPLLVEDLAVNILADSSRRRADHCNESKAAASRLDESAIGYNLTGTEILCCLLLWCIVAAVSLSGYAYCGTDIINVRQKGAQGTGYTDATDAVARALAVAGNGAVHFSGGNYMISRSLHVATTPVLYEECQDNVRVSCLVSIRLTALRRDADGLWTARMHRRWRDGLIQLNERKSIADN